MTVTWYYTRDLKFLLILQLLPSIKPVLPSDLEGSVHEMLCFLNQFMDARNNLDLFLSTGAF